MSFKVIWSKRSKKEAKRLDDVTRARVFAAVKTFAEDEHGDLKRLQGTTNLYRLRVGDWRVIFEMVPGQGVIRIDRVRHRREAYRD